MPSTTAMAALLWIQNFSAIDSLNWNENSRKNILHDYNLNDLPLW